MRPKLCQTMKADVPSGSCRQNRRDLHEAGTAIRCGALEWVPDRRRSLPVDTRFRSSVLDPDPNGVAMVPASEDLNKVSLKVFSVEILAEGFGVRKSGPILLNLKVVGSGPLKVEVDKKILSCRRFRDCYLMAQRVSRLRPKLQVAPFTARSSRGRPDSPPKALHPPSGRSADR